MASESRLLLLFLGRELVAVALLDLTPKKLLRRLPVSMWDVTAMTQRDSTRYVNLGVGDSAKGRLLCSEPLFKTESSWWRLKLKCGMLMSNISIQRKAKFFIYT